MQTSIEKILQDLYQLDPEFKKHEEKLKVVISELLSAKPGIEIDPAFAAGLRRKLIAQADLKSYQPSTQHSFMFNKNLNFILGGALAIAIVFGGTQYYQNNLKSPQQALALLSRDVEIVSTNKGQAFGTLTSATVSARGGGTENAVAMADFGTTSSAPAAVPVPTTPVTDSKMIAVPDDRIGFVPPYYQPYQYVYKGEDLPSLNANQDVFKRIPVSASQSTAGAFIKQFSLGLIDINKFQDAKLQNFSLNEDRPFGYTLYTDLTQGNISISQNWQQWPHPENNCRDEACYQQYRLKYDQIPDDASLIAASNAFLSEYGISREGYGEPVVQNYWKEDYARSQDKASYYIPDQLTVVYPLLLQGKTILDEGGNKTGMMISVDARTKRVTSAYNLVNRTYEQSSYAGETDSARIIKLAESGGWRNYIPYAAAETPQDPNLPKPVLVELGTPTIELIQIYNYDNATYTSQELYAPALVFPVTQPNQENIYVPKNIIVPLVKELLDGSNAGDPIRYMNSVPPSDAIPAPVPAK